MTKNEEKLSESWVANAEAWTQSVREQQIESRKVATDAAVINAIVARKPRKVLDVGCGEGWLSREIHRLGINVVGFDGSQALIEKANGVGGGQFLHLNYDAFITNPQQVGNGFDVAVCNFSLFSAEIKPLLNGLSAVLSSKGVIMIHTLHPYSLSQHDRYEDGWKEETFSGMGEGYKAAMPWFYRTMESWLREIHASGLKLVECKEPIHPTTGKPLSLLLTAIVD